MKNKRKIIAHLMKKMSRTYSFRFTAENELYLKAQPNREKFINELITKERLRIQEENEKLNRWREILYK